MVWFGSSSEGAETRTAVKSFFPPLVGGDLAKRTQLTKDLKIWENAMIELEKRERQHLRKIETDQKTF